ncbi:MAG TPA: DUF1850 domain-containing protein [Mesorhizobium sp.]|jgi:hypothetical protein|nr:DUF1850 domain-containing protein [Mesorhizobium sp.]
MSLLCVSGGGITVKIVASAFTLGWVHSIEKAPIEDAWAIEDGRLRLVESRIKGSGAGIEPGADARLVDGWLRWTPEHPFREKVTLRRSGFEGTGDWTLCLSGKCRPLGDIVPTDADPVTLEPC